MKSLSAGQELAAAKTRFRHAKVNMENEGRAVSYWTAKLYQEQTERRQTTIYELLDQ